MVRDGRIRRSEDSGHSPATRLLLSAAGAVAVAALYHNFVLSKTRRGGNHLASSKAAVQQTEQELPNQLQVRYILNPNL